MTKIDFGSANEMDPRGSFEEIGIVDGNSRVVSGNYLGAFKIADNNYIVSSVSLAWKGIPVGKIVVREALMDLYPDGSGVLFLDQKCSTMCEKLEELLNTPKAKELMNQERNPKDVCSIVAGIDAYLPEDSFNNLKNSQGLCATAIKHEVFENKRALISRCRKSFSDLQKELEELRAQIEQLESGRNR